MIEVLVDRIARVDLPLDAVQAGAQHRREREVRVAGRVRRAVLDSLRGLDALVVHRDPDVRAAVALRPGDEHRRLKARHEPGFEAPVFIRSEEHTSELQSLAYLVCRLLLEKKKKTYNRTGYGALIPSFSKLSGCLNVNSLSSRTRWICS